MRFRVPRVVVLAGAFIGLAACALTPRTPVTTIAEPPACTAPVVRTSSGDVCGLRLTPGRSAVGGETVDAYLGIRYATARRWAPPEPVRAAGLVRATAPGKICPQSTVWADADLQDEDCLFLNVWTPGARSETEGVPVIVYVPSMSPAKRA